MWLRKQFLYFKQRILQKILKYSPVFSAEVPRPRDPMHWAGWDGVVGARPAERRPGRHQALRGLRRQLHQQVLGPRQEEERTVRNKT